jgi:uroporphyrinogen-III decarboxylase
MVVAELRSKKDILSYHICGDATPIVLDMVDTGAQLLEVDQKADQAVCKAAARGRAILVGTVDPKGHRIPYNIDGVFFFFHEHRPFYDYLSQDLLCTAEDE